MSYINIDKALESIDLIAKNDGEKFDKDSARYAIQTTETEDVVPVVRCKNCKHYKAQEKSAHWENKTKYCCRVATLKVNDNDFCSYGERKEENG